jgi:predicted nucleic acid-binding protein
MKEAHKPNIKEKRYILLDTNIISSFGNDDLGTKILEVLNEAVTLGYGLAISDITFLEIINGTSVETEIKMLRALEGLERFYVKKEVLVAAAHLGGLYKESKLPLDQFGMADQIIAATAILHNCIIFTKNGRDFPVPFFKELDRRMIEYTSKDYPVCVPTYFLEPQLEFIDKYYSARIAKAQKGTKKPSVTKGPKDI